MTSSLHIRYVLHIFASVSFLLFVVMVTRVVNGEPRCRAGRFGYGCQLTCRCQGNQPCHEVTGLCPGNCSEGWSGPNCQRQNVALGMPTEMKTSDWTKGGRVVDGNLNTCVTSSSNRTGWWRVDLLSSRLVYFMDIVFRRNNNLQLSQMSRGRVRVHISDYVDTFWGKPCTRVPASHKRSKFTCDIPSSGRYFGLINRQGQITLCEVSVYVCSLYTFGEHCSHQCACSDREELCHPVTGTCSSGCRDGWTGRNCSLPCSKRYGPACRNPCGRCHGNTTCDHVTGMCHQGCAPGWKGARCLQACEPGFFGVDCLYRCGYCLDQDVCHPDTGHCPWRCEPGWSGDRCDTECVPGRHGQSCDFPCGHCQNDSVCDKATGVCPHGCQAGFEGLFCTKVCISGRWGPNCESRCGHCLHNKCDNVTGRCDPPGCQTGWAGSKCDTECAVGTFGANCSQLCSNCQGACSSQDGLCPASCRPGWAGPQCLDKCSNRTFGQDCAHICGHCSNQEACNHVTGQCPGVCAEGYHTRLCHIRKQNFSLRAPNLLSMLVACMVVFVATLVAVFTCLIVRWRRDNQHGVVDKQPQPYKQTVV